MTENESRKPERNFMLNRVKTLGEFITEPAKNVEAAQFMRVRLLSGYLILSALIILGAAIFFRTIDTSLFFMELSACVILIVCYGVSRTRHHKIALPFGVLIPAITSVVIVLVQPQDVNMLASLMWLSLPLLAAGLFLSVTQSHLLAAVFILLAIGLAISNFVDYGSLAMLVLFFIAIAFFTVSFSSVRKGDYKAIEKHLADLTNSENTLKESEEKYRNLFELAKDAIILTDFKSGVIIDANEMAATMTGIPREKLVGMEHPQLFPPETAKETVDRFVLHADEFKDRIYSDDVVLQRPDGKQVPTSVSNSFFNFKGRQTTQSVYRDMTERHAMEKKLRDSEEMFSKAFHSSPAAISISTFGKGEFIAVNDAYIRDTGYTREELIGKSAEEFNMWVNRKDQAEVQTAAENRQRISNREIAFRYKSGEIRNSLVSTDFLEVGGQPCFMLTCLDITDYKRTQKALGETEKQLQRVIHISPQQFLVTRVKDGAFLQLNESFTRITGYTREEVAGKTVFDINLWANPDDRLVLLRELQKAGRADNMEFDFRAKSGETLTQLVSCEQFEMEGEPCLLTMFTDITERKRMEKALKASEEKFSKAFHAIPESIAIKNLKNKTFVDVNAVFCEALGKKRDEVIGHTPAEIGIPEPELDTDSAIDMIHKHGPIRNIEQVIKVRGEMKGYALFSADIVDIGGEPHMITIYNNITERKRMEQALHDSEERFSRAFQSIPESFAITRIKDQRFVEVNNVFCKAVGIAHDKVIGHTTLELGLPDPGGTFERIVEHIRKYGPIQNEEQKLDPKTKKGGYALFSADIVDINGEPHLISLFNDITERKQMEQALRDSEEKFSKAFHAVPERLCISRISDGMVIDANAQFLNSAGFDRKNVIGHSVYELHLWERDERQSIIDSVRKYGPIIGKEIIHQTREGEIQTSLLSADIFNVAGEPCLITISNNITQRKLMEQALRDSEEKFSKIFHTIPDSVAITLVEDGSFVDVNDYFVKATGIPREKIIGHTPVELGLFTAEAQGQNLTETIKRNKSISNFEIILNEGSNPLYFLYSADIAEISGKPCIISVMKNISQLKSAEIALRESEEKFSKAFNGIPESISISRVSDGIFVDANDTFFRSVDRTREQAIGHTLKELGLMDGSRSHDLLVKKIKETGSVSNLEQPYTLPSGEKKTSLLSADIINISGEPCMITIANDITERKKMEEALKNSEERLSKIFRAIPERFCITAVSDGRIFDANPTFLEAAGLTREEAIGHTIYELGLWNDDRVERDDIIRTIQKRGQVETREITRTTRDGRTITILLSADIINIDGEPFLLTIAADISERKKIEQALKASEEKFAKAFQAVPEDVVIYRIKDSVFVDVNDSFAQYNGLSREQIIGHTSSEIGLKDSPKHPEELIETIKKSGGIFNREVVVKPQTNEMRASLFSARIIDIAGEPCVLAVSADITERKRMEEALKESEKRFFKAFNDNPDGISISRLKDGVFVEVNESYLQMTGYTRDELIGHTAAELNLWANPEDRQKMEEKKGQRARLQNEEMAVRTKYGETRSTLLSSEYLELGGEPCVMVVTKDITERKQMENALKESEAKLSKIFQAIPDQVVITRARDSVYVDVNDNFARYHGLTRDQIIGRTPKELNLKNRPKYADNLVQIIEKEGGVFNQENIFSPDTDQMEAYLFTAGFMDVTGERCVMAVSRDITERKRMEKKLENEAIRRRIFIEQSRDGIVILDQKGNVTEANRRFAEMLGYTPEEILTLNVIDWEAVMPAEQIEKGTKDLGEEGELIETKHRRKDGSLYDVEISSNGVVFQGQKLIFCACRDITERKRMERDLKESEEKFSKAFHTIPEAITIISSRDGRFMEVNDAFCRFINRSREEIVGRRGNDLNLPDENKVMYNLIQEVKNHGKVSAREVVDNSGTDEMTTRLISGDTLEIHGEPCVITMAMDITAIKKIEIALRESEAKFSKIFRLSPHMIVISRHADGKSQSIIDVNDSFMHHTGFTREECLGKSALELGLWQDIDKREKVTKEVIARGHTYNQEGEFIIKSGEKRTWLFSMEHIDINEDRCLMSIITDITERKKAEEQLRQAMIELKLSSDQLKATNKELESFSYSVSHDLRSPLRTIDGFSQALLEDYGPKLDETAQHYLDRMRNASQKMGELIDGLLKLSRLTRGEMRYETVDLSALAEEISQRMRETDPERRAEFIIQKDLKVTGDLQLLRALMENLLGNAWKFTQKTPCARIEFGRVKDNGKKTYFVRDNGAGFDMAFADKLFGAFQRLHNDSEFPGTGIGLATVQRVINRHGGSIRAEGGVNQGAVFYFTL